MKNERLARQPYYCKMAQNEIKSRNMEPQGKHLKSQLYFFKDTKTLYKAIRQREIYCS